MKIAVLGSLLLLSVSSVSNAGTVTLAWDASTDPAVVAYKVYYGGQSGNYTNSFSVAAATTATVSNLADGVTYYFSGTCVSSNGVESDFAPEVSGTTPLPNAPPTLDAISNLAVNENAGMQTVSLTGITSGSPSENQALTVTAVSSKPSIVPNPAVNYASPAASGSLTFTPVAYASGSAVITVTVNDGAASNNIITRKFTVTVNSVNQAPTLDPIANVAVNENSGLQTVNLTGIGSGAPNETQTLAISVKSSNTALVPTPAVSYSSPAATGSLSFKPATNSYGTSTITVTVNDGGASNNVATRSFTITVNQVNTPPSISAIPDQTIVQGSTPASVPFTVSDLETAAGSLTLSGSSDNATLVPRANIAFGGSGGNRTVTVTPAAGQAGTARITITVSDGTDSATSAFQLTVRARPSAPANFRLVQVF